MIANPSHHLTEISFSVVDRHRFDDNPDPNYHFDADPDPDPTPLHKRKSEILFLLIGYSQTCLFKLLYLSRQRFSCQNFHYFAQ
jgi:hypothetical protein